MRLRPSIFAGARMLLACHSMHTDADFYSLLNAHMRSASPDRSTARSLHEGKIWGAFAVFAVISVLRWGATCSAWMNWGAVGTGLRATGVTGRW